LVLTKRDRGKRGFFCNFPNKSGLVVYFFFFLVFISLLSFITFANLNLGHNNLFTGPVDFEFWSKVVVCGPGFSTNEWKWKNNLYYWANIVPDKNIHKRRKNIILRISKWGIKSKKDGDKRREWRVRYNGVYCRMCRKHV